MAGTQLLVRCGACRKTSRQFMVPVPFCAVWPFEILVLPRGHDGALPALADDERNGVADMLRRPHRR